MTRKKAFRHSLLLLVTLAVLACSGEADFSGQLQTETLSAEEYQEQIRSIDRLLFTESPLGEFGVRSLQKEVEGLAARVRAHDDSKFLELESLELRRLALVAGRLPKTGNGRPLQNDWMRIRSNLFDDRAWFARSARDLMDGGLALASPVPQPTATTLVAMPETLVPTTAVTRTILTGRWQVTSVVTNGRPVENAELSGSIWTLAPPRLIMRSPNSKETTSNFNVEEDYIVIMNASGEDGWMRYELTPGNLRVAFYDGLTGKPSSFEPQPNQQDPMLVVVTLRPLP